MKTKLRLSQITLDDRAQPRAALLPDRVAEYVEDMGRGDEFPPPVVFHDKADIYWLADGFHRYHAAVGLELKTVECDVRKGELRDAILYSCGANAEHGLRRTNADKRAAVTKLLKDDLVCLDDNGRPWGDSKIASQCRVNRHLVASLREQLKPVEPHLGESQDRPRAVTRGGTTYTQKTGNIGRKRGQPAEDKEPEPPLSPQMVKDNENGWISSALWEIERQIGSLPAPKEAAQRFPTCHYHTFSSAKLRSMSRWLESFAEHWDTVTEEFTHGKKRTAA
jgi:hypothetical protein